MTDYLSEYGVKLGAEPAKKPAKRNKRKLHVLLYGDSIDRVMLEDICEIGGGVRQQCWVDPKSARFQSCRPRDHSQLKLRSCQALNGCTWAPQIRRLPPVRIIPAKQALRLRTLLRRSGILSRSRCPP